MKDWLSTFYDMWVEISYGFSSARWILVGQLKRSRRKPHRGILRWQPPLSVVQGKEISAATPNDNLRSFDVPK